MVRYLKPESEHTCLDCQYFDYEESACAFYDDKKNEYTANAKDIACGYFLMRGEEDV